MLLIIDADGLAFESYFALESKVDFPMAFGVIRKIPKLYRDFKPEGIFFVFDSVDIELKKIFPEYRKNREEPWELGKTDYNLMLEILSGLGFQVFKENKEADRIIAVLVKRFKPKYKILIYSDDKDFFQLLDKQVSMFGPNRGWIDYKWVTKKFNLPNNVLFRDFLIFTGDPVDRIPRILKTEDAYNVIREKGQLEEWFFDGDFSGLDEDIITILKEKKKEIIRNFQLINLLDENFKPKIYKKELTVDEILDKIEKVGLKEKDIERALDVAERIKIFKI